MRKKVAVGGTALVLLLAALLVVLAGCTNAGELSSSDMAKVGSNIITKSQFDTRLAELEKQYEGKVPTKEDDTYKDFQKSVLEYLVQLEVVSQNAAKMNITVSDDEVTAQIDSIKQMFGGDETKFQEALTAQNMTVESLKKAVREQQLMSKVFDSVTKDATVTDAQIQTYYDQHKDEYKTEETRTTRHILFAPKNSSGDASTTASEADWNAALELAKKVRGEIVKGADFGEMAKQYSDDPGTKDLGGDLGEVQKGMMVAEFEAVNFSLDKLAVSEPVKTQYGYHLIQVTDVKEARTQSLDEVKETIKESILRDEQQKTWNAWLETATKELGTVYKAGWEPTTTTTTGAGGTSTTAAGATTTTAPAQTTTTATGSNAAGSTTTTK